MTPRRWVDDHGDPHPTRPCLGYGQPARILHPRLEHLRMIGWRLFAVADYVSWSGHRQEFLLVPHIDGVMGHLVPIEGEAA
jgi:hypothetical protein